MELKKYHDFIENAEETDSFQTLLTKGCLKINYFPFIKKGCNPNTLGELNEKAFIFSCRHFAAQYKVSPDVLVDKQWHVLRHITQRNQITHRLMNIIAHFQEKFLLTGEQHNLRHLPYKKIIDEYSLQFPKCYIDPSVISRIIRHKTVFFNGSRNILLAELLPKKSYLLGLKISRLTAPSRSSFSDIELRKELYRRFHINVSERYVSCCRNLMNIQSKKLRKKKRFLCPTGDSTVNGFLRMVFYLNCQTPRASMCSA